MYNIMTRSRRDELDGYENAAFLPLLRDPSALSSNELDRITALTTLYSSHIEKAKLDRHDERIDTLFKTVDLEEKMTTDSLCRMFAPSAKKAGIAIGEANGIRKGIRKGVCQGIRQERAASLSSQRSELYSAVRVRFGTCPNALRAVVSEIDDLNAVINLRVFTLTEAQSVEEIIERAQIGAH